MGHIILVNALKNSFCGKTKLKVVTLLHKRLEGFAVGEKFALFHELSAKTMEFLSEVSFCVPFSLDYNELQPADYFKSAGVKFEKKV